MGKLSSILKLKCPRCGKGDLYAHNLYLPISKKPFDMKKYCPECGLRYEKETGFFYGAMFVSYGLNVALFVACIIIHLLFFEHYGWWAFGIVYVLLTLLATAVIFRYSRSFWIGMYVKHNPNIVDQKNLDLIAQGDPNIA